MDYKTEARRRVRSYLRKLKIRKWYETVNKSRNWVVNVQEDRVQVKGKVSNGYQIKATSLEKAALHVYLERTITREDLVQHYSRYSSSVFGMLLEIFSDISRLTKSRSGLARLSLRGIRVYLSGSQSSLKDMHVAKDCCSAQWLLISYAYVRDDSSGNWIRYVQEAGFQKVFIDSGAFTAANINPKLKRRVRPIVIEEYISWLKRHMPYIHTYSSLDVIGDHESTMRNYQLMLDAGLSPVPVFHLDEPLHYLEEFSIFMIHLLLGSVAS